MSKTYEWTSGLDKTVTCRRHINSGAYGDVYEMAFKEIKILGIKLKRPNDGQKFARKLIRVNTESADNIEKEANILYSLHSRGGHANIIKFLKHGWLAGSGKTYFIDMELANFSLADYIAFVFSNKTLPTEIDFSDEFSLALSQRNSTTYQELHNIWIISKDIANGLAFLHNCGYVHRDLKPQNVLYCHRENTWKLSDFGFSSEAMSIMVVSTQGRGTTGYRAPELVDCENPQYNNRADIWGLGCILHELATGKRIFRSDISTFLYARGSIEPPLCIKFESAFWQHHVSEALRELLAREAQSRPSAIYASRLISSYVKFLSFPSHIVVQNSHIYPSYSQWKGILKSDRMEKELLFELMMWYLRYKADNKASVSPLKNIVLTEIKSWKIRSSENQIGSEMVVSWSDTAELLAAKGLEDEVSLVYKAILDGTYIKEGRTPILWAAENGHINVINELKKAGADVSQQDIDGNTPMFLAALNGHVEIIKLLKEAGANVSVSNNDRMMPLHGAAKNGHIDAIKTLIEFGADISSQDINGNTPKRLATQNGHAEALKILEEAGGGNFSEGQKEPMMPITGSARNGPTWGVESLKVPMGYYSFRRLNNNMSVYETDLSFYLGMNLTWEDVFRHHKYLRMVGHWFETNGYTEIAERIFTSLGTILAIQDIYSQIIALHVFVRELFQGVLPNLRPRAMQELFIGANLHHIPAFYGHRPVFVASYQDSGMFTPF